MSTAAIPRKLMLLLSGLGLFSLANGVIAGALVSEAQARILAPAIAKVILQRTSTTTLLRYCGHRFPSLQAASDRARTQWLQRNHAILHKADSLHDRLWRSLKRQQSGFTAETFGMDINRLIQQDVQHVRDKLAQYPTVQQHAICNHLILSVRAGDWDIAHKQAKAYAILENFH